MTSRKTVLYAAALAGALTLGLSGCNAGEKDPTPTASPTGSASSTVSPSPTSSGSGTGSGTPSPSVSVSVPAAARAHTEAGGIAFATFYATLASDSYSTNEVEDLSALALPECKGCAATVDIIEENKSNGWRIRDRRATITGGQLSSVERADGFDVDVAGAEEASEIIDTKGNVVEKAPAAKMALRLSLRWLDGSWRVAELSAVTS